VRYYAHTIEKTRKTYPKSRENYDGKEGSKYLKILWK
jgi:hypothetical protein